MSMGLAALALLMIYCAIGAIVAIAFVGHAAPHVLPGADPARPPDISFGARVLLLPGAFLLWPIVANRWSRMAEPTQPKARRK